VRFAGSRSNPGDRDRRNGRAAAKPDDTPQRRFTAWDAEGGAPGSAVARTSAADLDMRGHRADLVIEQRQVPVAWLEAG
jgi:hypothetical protein